MPEEVNRVLTDHISTYLFCPSDTSVVNLRREGFLLEDAQTNERPSVDHPFVMQVGDVMYDMLLHASQLAENKSRILAELKIEPKAYDLLTLHRAENTDEPRRLEEIIAFVNQVTAGTPVLFPMHPRMSRVYAGIHKPFAENVRIIDPLGYFDLLTSLKNARRLLTDSGGMQKEAYWLQVPCITLRDETEWVETVQSGWNILFRDYHGEHRRTQEPQAYGDGHAANKIIHSLLERSSLNYE
jgi:UDP-N-acetylglucosamine 2-epimerase